MFFVRFRQKFNCETTVCSRKKETTRNKLVHKLTLVFFSFSVDCEKVTIKNEYVFSS